MTREISAGGVVVRLCQGEWQVAVIEPNKTEAAGQKLAKKVVALPKGLLDPGEKAQQAAVREVREETGLRGTVVKKLGDIRYTYVRTWGDRQRVFKVVSFYLLRYEAGEIDDVAEGMRLEVKRAWWVQLAGASRKLSYSSERKMMQMAEEYVAAHGEEVGPAPAK